MFLGETLTAEDGTVHSLAAEVMLVTRNIVVRGGSHDDMVRLGFGGRVLVSSSVDDNGNSLVGKSKEVMTE